LDRGGIRGLITLGILKKIEDLIADRTRLKLCEYFDYIAGTSTGAIIAAGLSRGMTTSELIDFYMSCGKQMFERSWIIERIKYFYTADPLKAKLQEVFGAETTLEPASHPSNESVKCLLLVVSSPGRVFSWSSQKMSRPIHRGRSAVTQTQNATTPAGLTAI